MGERRPRDRGKRGNAHAPATGRHPLRVPVEVPDEKGLVTIRFLGAARTTTGSLHRIRTPRGDVLLECGMYQGHRAEAEQWNRELPVDPDRVQAVLLSHGHIDHCGALPNLVRMGYGGPIWCTEATADLLPVMLMDSARIQESDVARVNRRRKEKGKPPKEPLYTVEDAKRTLRLVRGVPYGREFEALRDVTVRFVDAGHILGSAAIHVTVRAGGDDTRIGFTGDLGRKQVPILRDPEPLGDVDWYLTESTYGNRDHEDTGDLMAKLEAVVKRAASRGGKVLIPAFAVGRTQLVLFLLHKLREADRIPDVPFYVDSPMATAATKVFAKHRDLYDEEARDFLNGSGPLFRRARTSFVSDSMESRALNTLEGSAVILSASGMCEGGRILHHLRHHGPDRRNIVLFVGYQAEHTLGRRILEGADTMKVYGERVALNAEVHRINGLSAHADRRGLLRYVRRLDRPPKQVFLVHGDEDRVAALGSYFAENGIENTVAPRPGDWHRLR